MTISSAADPRIAFFDQLAAHWDSGEQDPQETVRRVSELASLLALKPGETLLEVGCGTGQLTGWLAAQVAPARVVAIDFAPAMVAAARAKGIPADFRVADVCCDELGEACFDVALCFHSFPHFRDPGAAVARLARALKPGGRLIVMHLAGRAQINAFHDGVGGAVAGDHLPDREGWDSLLKPLGLVVTAAFDREGLFFLRAVAGPRLLKA